ncbi:hypothetical protein C7451_103284 [Blastomonas natatoria]|uniref:Uncharacterized protein n=1 Tax=Blastomonas natatoria TaxID=34015 RepID=A0A2V3V8R6_9SPHN|nr:hypothetical protein C7451_103284 [Blastomonas natatoria]
MDLPDAEGLLFQGESHQMLLSAAVREQSLHANCVWHAPAVMTGQKARSSPRIDAVRRRLRSVDRRPGAKDSQSPRCFFMETATIFLKSLKRWWARQGLNLRPHPCEGSQLNQIVSCFTCRNSLLYEAGCTRFVRVGTLSPLKTCMFGRNWRATKPVGRPPDQERKTAGRAGTLRGGNIYSGSAISLIYATGESGARAILAGGAS